MLESRGQVEIARTPEEVFDYLADLRNEPKWLPGATDVHATSRGAIGPKSAFEGTYARAGIVRCVINEYERPTRLTIHGEAKGMTFEDIITLTGTVNGTQLHAVMRTQAKGFFRLVAPMIGRVIDRQFQANWDHLRAVLER